MSEEKLRSFILDCLTRKMNQFLPPTAISVTESLSVI